VHLHDEINKFRESYQAAMKQDSANSKAIAFINPDSDNSKNMKFIKGHMEAIAQCPLLFDSLVVYVKMKFKDIDSSRMFDEATRQFEI
jgi:hypothetical protein